MSSRVYLLCPPLGHEPAPTLRHRLNHTAASNAFAFQSPSTPNARMSLCTQSVYSVSFPPRPLCIAPSRLPNTIHFRHRRQLNWMSAPAHRNLLLRNVVSMLSNRIISRARLYEVIRWSGLLRCTPMMRSKNL